MLTPGSKKTGKVWADTKLFNYRLTSGFLSPLRQGSLKKKTQKEKSIQTTVQAKRSDLHEKKSIFWGGRKAANPVALPQTSDLHASDPISTAKIKWTSTMQNQSQAEEPTGRDRTTQWQYNGSWYPQSNTVFLWSFYQEDQVKTLQCF